MNVLIHNNKHNIHLWRPATPLEAKIEDQKKQQEHIINKYKNKHE